MTIEKGDIISYYESLYLVLQKLNNGDIKCLDLESDINHPNFDYTPTFELPDPGFISVTTIFRGCT